MSEQNKINILISCHKKFNTLDNKYVSPIQVGCALKDFRFAGMIFDDDGENISEKNKRYCELTAQYWAWKNLQSDYYGFFHYRRYLSFSKKKVWAFPFCNPTVKSVSEQSIKRLNLTEENIEKFVSEFDLVLPKRNFCFHNRFQYKVSKGHRVRDLDFCLSVIKKDYPEIYPYAKKYMRSPMAYLCNTFVMKKQLFNEYCEFLFDVLSKHESKYDCKDYDTYAYRVSGFLAERLFGIYATYLIKAKKIKYKRVQRVLIKNVEVKD